jgi:hypothetical protein
MLRALPFFAVQRSFMKIIKNEKRINLNSRISRWTSVAALTVLGLGMYISFTEPALYIYSAGALVLGFALTQIGMYMGNKYGRSPRIDEKLDIALKGLQNEFVMYHYITPVSHLLVGPAGVWVVMPYHQRGQVTYQKNRWRISGGGFAQAYMRIFGQEGLGRPDLEVEGEVNALKRHLIKQMDEAEIPEIHAVIVFTDEAVEIDAADAPVPTLRLKQLKEFIRQKGKGKLISQSQLAAVKAALPE